VDILGTPAGDSESYQQQSFDTKRLQCKMVKCVLFTNRTVLLCLNICGCFTNSETKGKTHSKENICLVLHFQPLQNVLHQSRGFTDGTGTQPMVSRAISQSNKTMFLTLHISMSRVAGSEQGEPESTPCVCIISDEGLFTGFTSNSRLIAVTKVMIHGPTFLSNVAE